MTDGRIRNLGGMYALYKAHHSQSQKCVFLFCRSSFPQPLTQTWEISVTKVRSLFTVFLVFHTDPSSCCSVSHHHRTSRRTRDSPMLGDCRLWQLLLCLDDDRCVRCCDGRGQKKGYTDVVHFSEPLQCITL